jgi:ribose-phosphate pyrophosphokinase
MKNDDSDALSNSAFNQIAITNSIPPWRLDSNRIANKLAVVDVTQLFATAIERIHTGPSIVDLLEP